MPIRSLIRVLWLSGALALPGLCWHAAEKLASVREAFALKTFFAPEETLRIAVHRSSPEARSGLLHRSEFDWQGKRIDVLERRLTGDSLVVIGYIDEAETQVKALFPWLFPDHETAPADPSPLRKKAAKFPVFALTAYLAYAFTPPTERRRITFQPPRNGLPWPAREVQCPPPLG